MVREMQEGWRDPGRFLLGHPDCQDFGRKFKIAFSGCADEPCGLVRMHDFGAVAQVKNVDGQERRGFAVARELPGPPKADALRTLDAIGAARQRSASSRIRTARKRTGSP